MKSNLVVPAIFLAVFVVCVIFGNNVIESGWSFLAGAVFALSVRDLGKELIKRVTHRQ